MSNNLNIAVDTYISRHINKKYAVGRFDAGGRWYPDDNLEKRDCCKYIRSPSRVYPYSLLRHCNSVEHIATLYGCDAKELRRAVRYHPKICTKLSIHCKNCEHKFYCLTEEK